MRRIAVIAALTASLAIAGEDGVRVVEDAGRWESGYGVDFYNVVGKLEITDGTARKWVKLRIDAKNEGGAVIATEHAYNETAEALSAPGADAAALIASGKVVPIAAGATQRFRTSFLKDEHPTITSHAVTVVEAPATD